MMANEKRLIDLDEAIDALGVEDRDFYCKHFLEERPIVDAVEVKHARWIRRGNEMKCSRKACGFIYYSNHDDFNYCPNCGAKMDGGNEDG